MAASEATWNTGCLVASMTGSTIAALHTAADRTGHSHSPRISELVGSWAGGRDMVLGAPLRVSRVWSDTTNFVNPRARSCAGQMLLSRTEQASCCVHRIVCTAHSHECQHTRAALHGTGGRREAEASVGGYGRPDRNARALAHDSQAQATRKAFGQTPQGKSLRATHVQRGKPSQALAPRRRACPSHGKRAAGNTPGMV